MKGNETPLIGNPEMEKQQVQVLLSAPFFPRKKESQASATRIDTENARIRRRAMAPPKTHPASWAAHRHDLRQRGADIDSKRRSVAVCCLSVLPAEPTNRLAREKSPYLLQHQHNPVDWYPWGEEAFARARQEDKPIFLSIGYSTCHWCHVMERESFENAEIAAFLNAHLSASRWTARSGPTWTRYT